MQYPQSLYENQDTWYPFELEIWQKGEEIRQYLLADNNNKLTESQISQIVEIATNPCAKRGRQSFVMLLGDKKFQKFAPAVALQIHDENVSGQVIDTITKMKAKGFSDVINPFVTHDKELISKNAKTYFEKIGSRKLLKKYWLYIQIAALLVIPVSGILIRFVPFWPLFFALLFFLIFSSGILISFIAKSPSKIKTQNKEYSILVS